jgi:hypothetical protein
MMFPVETKGRTFLKLGLSFLTVTPISLAQPRLKVLSRNQTLTPCTPTQTPTMNPPMFCLNEPFYISALHHIHFTHELPNSGMTKTSPPVCKATQQVGALTNFFLDKAVDVIPRK